ncbi:MAG: L-seryl-tRNA(Sec) selenium transferase [Myxococcota bacterium]
MTVDQGERSVNAELRALPAVDRLVEAALEGQGLARYSVLAAARAVLAETRSALAAETSRPAVSLGALVERVRERARRLERPFPRRVLNATGIVLHTNLGRAPLARGALDELVAAAAGYSDLELDLETGERGSRGARVAELLCLLSGAEAAQVVNNTAAALFLAVDTLAAGREVVVSRGELVEIGGSFRVPEIMSASRARLREIGTTNRTHLRDYRDALGPDTGMLLKVHRSNFRIAGFTSEVGVGELAPLAREHGLPLVEDRGSGSFVDLSSDGISEPLASEGLRSGADLVLFSADKLLGGPQAGVVIGKRALVERMKTSPLARALRVDKLTLAALHWTLRALAAGRADEIPVLAMLRATPAQLEARASDLAARLRAAGLTRVSVETGSSPVGGGALPELERPGAVVRVVPASAPNEAARRLRAGDPPVLARIQRDALLFDPRTLADEEIEALVRRVAELAR